MDIALGLVNTYFYEQGYVKVKHLKVGGGLGGLGGSEKHIWKIFHRGDPEIGSPGLLRGSYGTNFIEKISLKRLFGYM